MATTAASSLIEQDREFLWHPFSQLLQEDGPIGIVKAKGTYLYAEDGSAYLDGISSWWTNLHGHCHPHIVNALQNQLNTLEHVLFADFTHAPAINLASRLMPLLPQNMSKVFYSDNGATSVETALKIALQYWHNKNPNTKRKKIVCFEKGYHGDTFGAMSISEKHLFSRPFWSHLFSVETLSVPTSDKCITELEEILKTDQVACFIFEPLILGVGGMITYSPTLLDSLLELCKKHDVITIGDEVMTGFGRSGPLFACESLQNAPDMICLSKAITGGFMPLGSTFCTEDIYRSFSSNAFLHGHTYTANPLACTAALASLDLLLQPACAVSRSQIEEMHENFCRQIEGHPSLLRCETLGTILILEYRTHTNAYYMNPLRNKLYRHFIEAGILLRPFGNVLYVAPPYCITPKELQFIYEAILWTL